MSALQQVLDLLARAYTPVFYDVLATAGGVLTALGLAAVTVVSLTSDVPFAAGIVYLGTFVGCVLAVFSLGRLAVVATGSAANAIAAAAPFSIITMTGSIICFMSTPQLLVWWIVAANVGVYALLLMCAPFGTPGGVPTTGEAKDAPQLDPCLRDLEHISHPELKVRRRSAEKVLARAQRHVAVVSGRCG
ncbi:uncharacterized protein LOC62_07G008983 [Vanrija pseudolonga]|uniref:Uncharacterized protein n=1 Tax=Vanrija pseudolonga TaxID=143232 RepID=A0AAF1BR36_9TREE|nr:hypothetical protein LOC62_07G008983 [Vanrija pseudolonga]